MSVCCNLAAVPGCSAGAPSRHVDFLLLVFFLCDLMLLLCLPAVCVGVCVWVWVCNPGYMLPRYQPDAMHVGACNFTCMIKLQVLIFGKSSISEPNCLGRVTHTWFPLCLPTHTLIPGYATVYYYHSAVKITFPSSKWIQIV